MKKKKSSYEGLQANVRGMKLPAIEVWQNKYGDRNYVVKIETCEFTCICPKTSLPDFATLYIEYIPKDFCAELKSFKNYLVAFRNVGIFHEHAINRILDDFTRHIKPRWVKIRGEFNIRGGIRTCIEAEKGRFSLS